MNNSSTAIETPTKVPLSPMEFYRSTPVGTALVETLNEMVEEGILDKNDAWSLLETFDANIQEAIRDNVALRRGLIFNKASGTLANFNNVGDLWKIEVDNGKFQVGKSVSEEQRIRILCKHDVKPT